MARRSSMQQSLALTRTGATGGRWPIACGRDARGVRRPDHLLAPGKPLYEAIASGQPHSLVLWGPPGTGKTTLARLIAARSSAHFIALSAVQASIKDIREAVAQAQQAAAEGQPTVLFLDEVHRFNKAQQDAFLPHVEDGTLTFIGATTENPSFEIIGACCRARGYVLKALSAEELRQLLQARACRSERGLGAHEARRSMTERWSCSPCGRRRCAARARHARARRRAAAAAGERSASRWSRRRRSPAADDAVSTRAASSSTIRFRRCTRRCAAPILTRALYWLARMLDGGCDPHYLARRITRMAIEDIGLADPRALQLALDAWQTYERLGSPGGRAGARRGGGLSGASRQEQCGLCGVWRGARRMSSAIGSLEVPLRLRNAPTPLMKQLGYGSGYRYAHDEPEAYAAGERYLPDDMPERRLLSSDPARPRAAHRRERSRRVVRARPRRGQSRGKS